MQTRVILAGCGNMGYAMLAGWLEAAKLEPSEAFVVEPNAGLRARAERLGVRVASDADEIPATARPELVVLAVKPQLIREVARCYRRFADGRTTFLSVAAGTAVETLAGILGETTPIVRCMPNTPAAIGRGMMVLYANRRVTTAAKTFIAALLEASGRVARIDDEELMDAVTAVCGSGPAYVFHFIECLAAAAERAGLPAETASLLAIQTVHGAAALAAESREGPAVLREQVTSPNGTTAAALAVLMRDDRLKFLIGNAVEAARLRSKELG